MANRAKQHSTDKGFGLSLMHRLQLEIMPLVDEHAERLPMGGMTPRSLPGVFGAEA